MYKIYLFDWGNTLMVDFPDKKGPMYLWDKIQAIENAFEILKFLSQNRSCYLATNALDSKKDEIFLALKRVGLDKFIKDIFCSQEVGQEKPSREFFEEIFKKLDYRKEQIVMIGDNLEKDILGALENDIDAILFDPKDKHKDYKDKKIKNLIELKNIV